MNVQVLTDPIGRLLRASPALPGSTHDLTAARQHRIIDALTDAGLKYWRLLRERRCSTNRITDVVKAIVVLHHVST